MAGILLLAGCSTTKHLPEGEILYTGQKKMIVENRSTDVYKRQLFTLIGATELVAELKILEGLRGTPFTTGQRQRGQMCIRDSVPAV